MISTREFLVLAVAGALGGGLYARRRSRNWTECAAWVMLPPSALGIFLACWGTFRLLPEWNLSACRLAASVRLVGGFPLYTSPNGAVMNDWMYGPVAALAYSPAALAAEPQAALQIAAVLNAIFYLVPTLALLWPAVRQADTRMLGVLAFVMCVGAHLAPFGTWYGAALLHVDTVTVCLGVLSCLAITRGTRLTLAAILCVLAIGAKQTDAPLALAQIAFLANVHNRRVALAYTLRLAVCGLMALAVASAWFGAETLWHDTVVIPSRFALEPSRFWDQLGTFALATFWIWPVAWVAWKSRPNLAEPSDDRSGWLLLVAALFLLPGNFLAAIKFGGGQNSLHSLSYGILGATALTLRLARTPATAHLAGRALLVGILTALTIDLHRVFTYGNLELASPGRHHREAFEFARAHPGQTYFPWDTLATLMAEGRDYPFDLGVSDWRRAGAGVDNAALRRVFPSTLTFVVYHEKDQSAEMRRVLPEFNQLRVSRPWLVYTRASPPRAADSNLPPAAR